MDVCENALQIFDKQSFFQQFKQKQMLEGHVGAVVALAASYLPPSDKPVSDMEDWTGQPSIIVSASSDSTIKIWVREVQDGECLHALYDDYTHCLYVST